VLSDEELEAEAAPARRGRGAARAVEVEEPEVEEIEDEVEEEEEADTELPARVAADGDGDERRGRRRRGRRGGRRRRGEGEAAEAREDGSEEAAPTAVAREERAERNERARNGRRRRRGRGRGRRVYEVDGGEWLDFVSADLKHLSPRPEGRGRNGPASRIEPVAEEAEPIAEIITHPALELADASDAPSPVAAAAVAELSPDVEEEAPPRYDEASLNYEPDQERRDKFLSRFSRWAKKGG
jgi:ribonuclease E